MYAMSQTLKNDADMEAVAAYVGDAPAGQPDADAHGRRRRARRAALRALHRLPRHRRPRASRSVQSPRVAGQSDWYLLSSLQKLKAGERGAYPNAAIMRGMAGTLADEQAMKDVIAYIMTLTSKTASNAGQ